MFGGGLGMPELVLILVIVLIVFGAGKLADAGGSLGKGIREFRRGMENEEVPATGAPATPAAAASAPAAAATAAPEEKPAS